MRKLSCGGLALLIVACAPVQPASVAALPQSAPETDGFGEVRAVILALRANHNRAIAAGDTEGFLRIAADDHAAVFGHGRIIRSKDELRRVWTARPEQCVRTPIKVEIGRVDGQLRAAESGEWRCDVHNPSGVYTGAYFAHWSEQGDGWRVVSDTYVSLACRGERCGR